MLYNYPIIKYPIDIEQKLQNQLTTVSFSTKPSQLSYIAKPQKLSRLSFYLICGCWISTIVILFGLYLTTLSAEILILAIAILVGGLIRYQRFQQTQQAHKSQQQHRISASRNNQRRKSLARTPDDAFLSERIDWSDNVLELKRSTDPISTEIDPAIKYFLKQLAQLPGTATIGHTYNSRSGLSYTTGIELIVPNGLGIAIEIDKPYQDSGEPCHCWDDNDTDKQHDRYLLSKGWIVVRFTERQTITNPKGCCGVIAELIIELIQDSSLVKLAKSAKTLKVCPQWSVKEAKRMSKQGFRTHYLRDNS
ncbi:hypothetical protein [Chamaesiphon sp.]|uniref:hypothetical protein n=1 Tax=Chamaesiphon sp. TaxID=2814140 RepID=UPI003593CADE